MYLFFDFETEGLPNNWSAPTSDHQEWPKPMSVAWAVYDDGQGLISENSYLIKPPDGGFNVQPVAFDIHGLTNERCEQYGNPLEWVMRGLINAMWDAKVIVGHNVDFDRKIADSTIHRMSQSGITHFPEFAGVSLPLMFPPDRKGSDGIKYIDIKNEGTKLCKIPSTSKRGGGYKWPSMDELIHYLFGETRPDAHDAAQDVRDAARCFFEMVNIQWLTL